LKDRLRPPEQSIAHRGIHTRGYVVDYVSHNKTITPVGTTTIRMAGGAICIDNASDTSSTASRIFCPIKEVNL
jgi:hypothetical protein